MPIWLLHRQRRLLPKKPQNSSGQKLGSGWGNAPSVQIIVDDAIIVLSADKIFKLDPDSGEILKEAQLAAKIDYGYTPPTYADGIIFCPLNGTVQAVNADTLESLWVYKDPIGGQALSPITCHNGYVYTGFWKQETADANYVCLSAADEDPSKTDEPKLATWTHTQKGGFYWAGSAAVGDAIIFGTDDGESGATSPTSKLMSVNGITGEVIASLDLTGDQRSAIAYDKESGRVFGTTKAGFLFSAAVGKDGSLSDLKQQQYGNNSQQMSTSSPVVYKGKAYIGFANTGNFGKENYLIAADANTLEEVYRVPLKGYPQGSVLMSTAYEDTEGKVCMYLSYNAQPGGITCIKAAPDETDAANVEVDEIYDAKGYEQYCITSIICGQDGTLYYKNDSSNVLAVGRVKKQDADLELLEVNESDTFGGSSIKPTTPDFDKNTVSYTAFNVTSDRTFANLWADAADKNASVKVYASAGAKADDEETGEIKGLNPGNTHTRYPVCFADESKTAVVRVEVTADDGKTQKTYYVVITKEPAGSDVDEALTDIVRGFADKNDYEKEEQAEIDIILKDLQRQLKSADNMEDKEIIIAKAKLDISKVETGESIAAKQLERVKRTAIDELKTAMPDLSEYRLQQQFDLMVILMEGQTQIERAENPDQVDQQLVRAKEKMAAVATNYELTIAETKANLETAVTAGTSASCNAVQVKWNRISGADGYQVMRAESASGTYTAVADTASVSFTDKKVSLGKTYYYKVRAYAAVEDETFYGNYSAVKTAKPVLSAPASVKAKAGRKQASISWKKTAGAGGYKVYRAVKKNGKYKTVKTITKASTVKYTNKS